MLNDFLASPLLLKEGTNNAGSYGRAGTCVNQGACSVRARADKDVVHPSLKYTTTLNIEPVHDVEIWQVLR